MKSLCSRCACNLVPRTLQRNSSVPSLSLRFSSTIPFSSDRDPAETEKIPILKYVGKTHKRKTMLYVSGLSITGALGLPQEITKHKNRRDPLQATVNYPHRLPLGELSISTVACGYGFTVLGSKTNDLIKVWGTGLNTDSQLGFHFNEKQKQRDDDDLDSGHLDFLIEPSPIQIVFKAFTKTKVVQVSCGRAHTLVLTDTEGIYSFGNNAFGQCGRPIIEGELYNGSRRIGRIDPTKFPSQVKQIKCGMDHSLFLTECGEVWACGWGADGQTGLGSYEKTGNPTKVKGDLEGVKIKKINTFGDVSFAVSKDGDLYGWGNSEYNQLGSITDKTQVHTPKKLPFGNVGKIVNAASGGSICCLLNDKGEVWVWGYGILGKGPDLKESKYPKKIPMTLFGQSPFTPDVRVSKVKCGLDHFAAVTNRGELFMWGKNNRGCLAIGEGRDQYFPWKILTPGVVVDVHCGVDHTVIVSQSMV